MTKLEYITAEEASVRLLAAYRRSGDGSFLEMLRRPFLNPIEQRDGKGRRKVHPLLMVGSVLLLIATVSLIFFLFYA